MENNNWVTNRHKKDIKGDPWANSLNQGLPKATEKCSVDYLVNAGYVGLYKPESETS